MSPSKKNSQHYKKNKKKKNNAQGLGMNVVPIETKDIHSCMLPEVCPQTSFLGLAEKENSEN